MMKQWIAGAVVAVVSAGAFAQEPKRGPEEKVVFEKRAFPFEAEVSVERLNVRMFPKADQTSVIVSILGLGEKVTVVGEREDFYQILPVKGCTAWIFGKNVKRDGAAGTVTAHAVPVRMDSRVNAEALCTVNEGETVKIVAEHMGWYKIEAPNAVKYFVGKKYVRPGKALEPVVAAPAVKDEVKKAATPAASGGDAEARQKIALADALLDEQKKLIDALRLDEVDFAEVVSNFEGAQAAAQSASVKAEAERGLKKYKDLQLMWMTYKLNKANEEKRLAEERAKVQRVEQVKPKEWVLTGYVDTCGAFLNRPGTHKLVMGGKIVGFLRVKEGDDKMKDRLNDFYQKYVGVNGVVIKNPEGWDGYSVVVVDEIVGLTKE
jgi:SH3-like domain-containing protein